MKNLKKRIGIGLTLAVILLTSILVVKNNRISKVKANEVNINRDESIINAYEHMENEENYVVEIINKNANKNYTRENWKECLSYINENYLELSEMESIDMEKINSYKLDYESVEKMNNEDKDVFHSIARGSGNNYYPTKCREYIEKYWDNNNKDFPYYDGKDCANFVSQCLNVYGYEMDEYWNCINKKPTVQWINAQSLTEYFSSKYSHIEDTAKGFSSKYIEYKEKINEYDIIALRNKQGRVYHVMLVSQITSDDILYTGHTNNRIDRSLKGALEDSKDNIRIVSTGNKGW